MTDIDMDCGCNIDFISYGVTEVTLCKRHTDIREKKEKQESENSYRQYYKEHPESKGKMLRGWVYSGNDPGIIAACKEEGERFG